MNTLPVQPLTPEQQKRLSIELYAVLGKQVKGYHAHYHMGENSSVPTEVARELMESVQFTLEAVGGYRPGESLEDQLARGQAVLERELADTRELYRVVCATAPEFHSRSHWEALNCLGKYLQSYDFRHFAHRSPPEPDYPLLIPLPEPLKGIPRAKGYLHCLWLENQIFDSMPGAVQLLDTAPPGYWDAPQNLCEQPLWNAMGKAILGLPLKPLQLPVGEYKRLAAKLEEGSLRERLTQAMDGVCDELGLAPALRDYARAAVGSLYPRLKAALPYGNIHYLFR